MNIEFKNEFLKEHGQHFIMGITGGLLFRIFGVINNSQLLPVIGAVTTTDYIRKHNKELIKRVLPDLFN